MSQMGHMNDGYEGMVKGPVEETIHNLQYVP